MIIALGADHGGFELKEVIKKHLAEKKYEIKDYGTGSRQSVDYPEYGFRVGEAVIRREADLGIIVCGTGIGISIAANKVRGIRAAVCTDTYMARMSREHNNANILALGARVVGEGLALDIVDTFLAASLAGRDMPQVGLYSAYEKNDK